MCKIAIALFALVAVAASAAVPTEQVPILSQDQDVNPDGSFHTKFETGNGISYQEVGSQKDIGQENAAQVSQGVASHTAPDGKTYTLTWVADENGFQPQGEHLPVAPPAPEIPAAIARALEYIKAHPYVEPQQ